MPALTVRGHCLIVGAVAEAASDLLAPARRRILPKLTLANPADFPSSPLSISQAPQALIIIP